MNFYLTSIEHRTYRESHLCSVLRVVDNNKILVSVVPDIPSYVYETTEDIDCLVLAPRYADSTITPIVSEWPCRVNICLPKHKSGWDTGPWRLLDIGEISKILGDNT